MKGNEIGNQNDGISVVRRAVGDAAIGTGEGDVGGMRNRVRASGSPALPPALRAPIGIMAVLAAAVATTLAVHYSGGVAAGRLDGWAKTEVQSLLPQPGSAALLIDLVGEPLVTGVLAGVLAATCLVLRRRRLTLVAIASPVLAALTVMALKPVTGRTIHGGYLAYPSGHTAAATALALVVALLAADVLRAGRVPGMLLVLAAVGTSGVTMAWSQVALGAHYPTDTLGGFCTAMVIVPGTAALVDWFAGRPRRT